MLSILLLLSVQLPVGPHLPARTMPEIHAINIRVQELLKESKFDEAAEALKSWPGPTIRYRVIDSTGSGLGQNAIGADKEAANVWKESTENRVSFEVSEDEQVILEFIRTAPPGDNLPKWVDGKLHAKIALSYGEPRREMPRRSVIMAIAKAFGMAIGHAPMQRHGFIMGVDDRLEMVGHVGPTSVELDNVMQLLEARERLELAIKAKTQLTPAKPKLVMTPTDVNFGIIDEGDKPRAQIILKNEGNAPLEFAVDASCRCLYLQRIEPLAPGETRVVEPGVDSTGFMGRHAKEIYIHSSDPVEPTQSIALRFESVPEYRVVPDAIQRIALADDGPTTFEIIVYSFPGRAVRVMSVRANLPEAKTEILPFNGDVVDQAFSKDPIRRTGYKIKVTFLPEFRSGSGFLNLAIETDSHSRPLHHITLQTQKGIAASPPSAYFGGIQSDEKASRSFRVSHPTERFKIVDCSLEGGPFTIETTPDDSDGFGYRVTVTYNGGHKGPISGLITIKTDHPKYKEITVPLTGHTR